MKNKKSVLTEWKCFVYDVWGNAKEGYEVNDTYPCPTNVILKLDIFVNNPGTKDEFYSVSIPDKVLKKEFNTRCKIEVRGDDTHYYVDRLRDDYPLGELVCLSHISLCPVLENDDFDFYSMEEKYKERKK